jgi:sugar/nucleoside kinase (ribokinase family)
MPLFDGDSVLVIAGKLVIDEVLQCAYPVRAGEQQRAVSRTLGGGGQVWHTARAAAAAGVAVRVTGRCGSDPDTEAVRRRLTDAGIDDRLLPAGEASRAVVLVDPGGERTIVSHSGHGRLDAERLPIDVLLNRAVLLHLDGYALDDTTGDALVRLAESAARREIPICLEPPAAQTVDQRRDRLAALPALFALLGRPDEVAAAHTHLGAAPALTVVHDQHRDVVITAASGSRRHPVPAAPDLPTLGAGDRFTGGWLAAVVRGEDPDTAVAAGVRAAQTSRW